MQAAYERAAALYRAAENKAVLNEHPQLKRCKGSNDMWYVQDIPSEGDKPGSRFVRYSQEQGQAVVLFDHGALAEALVPRYAEKAEPHSLPIIVHMVDDGAGLVYFTLQDAAGEFTLETATGTVTWLRFQLHGGALVTAPDGKRSIFAEGGNLFCRCNLTGKVTQLTRDGRGGRDYGLSYYRANSQHLLGRATPMMDRPAVCWSPDSRYFLTYRNDSDALGRMPLYQSAPLDGTQRPKAHSYPYAIPGDDHVMDCKLYVYDVEQGVMRPVMMAGRHFSLMMSSIFGPEGSKVQWTEDGQAYFLWFDRFFKTARGIAVRAAEAQARVLVEDSYETFAYVDWFGAAGQVMYQEPNLRYLSDTGEVIWHSEAEGWSSLYLYDADSGKQLRRLTPGGWVVRRVRYYDPTRRELYFTAGGREEGIDPYMQLLYSVNLDTAQITRLSHETAEHEITFPEHGGYYIDIFSTVSQAPSTVVRDLSGKTLCHLCTADLSGILDTGYIFPEPFEALARDGVTKIYGILIKPYGFDPSKKYPVVNYVYGGAQKIVVSKAFQYSGIAVTDPNDGLQSLAQMGFVGVMVDGLATPLREKAIHDRVYGKHEEACGLEDHVCAIEQLAQRYSWIDAERVGLWGVSGGGYATARGMLQFPHFFKVGVSLCGDHDQSIYNAQWGERWCGPYSPEAYKSQSNATLAANLKGKLLLVHGDLDDNVHPAASIRLADALIQANKTFDFLLYPNADHMLGKLPYVTRMRWDYFVRHLLGETPPEDFRIMPDKAESKEERNDG